MTFKELKKALDEMNKNECLLIFDDFNVALLEVFSINPERATVRGKYRHTEINEDGDVDIFKTFDGEVITVTEEGLQHFDFWRIEKKEV